MGKGEVLVGTLAFEETGEQGDFADALLEEDVDVLGGGGGGVDKAAVEVVAEEAAVHPRTEDLDALPELGLSETSLGLRKVV